MDAYWPEYLNICSALQDMLTCQHDRALCNKSLAKWKAATWSVRMCCYIGAMMLNLFEGAVHPFPKRGYSSHWRIEYTLISCNRDTYKIHHESWTGEHFSWTGNRLLSKPTHPTLKLESNVFQNMSIPRGMFRMSGDFFWCSFGSGDVFFCISQAWLFRCQPRHWLSKHLKAMELQNLSW